MDQKQRLLSEDIATLDLSIRAEECLRRNDICTIGCIVERSPFELLRIKGLGRKILQELRGAVASRGLSLKPNQLTSRTDPDYMKSIASELRKASNALDRIGAEMQVVTAKLELVDRWMREREEKE